MSEADRLTVAAGVPAVTLMENAGRAVMQEIIKRWSKRSTVVLCGPGNNGGDGFVVARLLREAGWPVRLAMLGTIEKLHGEARVHANQWQGIVEPLKPEVLDGAELVVDAIFGAGLSRPLEGNALVTLAEVAARKLEMVAVDVPSGIMGDSGACVGAVRAALTVTFFRKKLGHLLLPGRAYCGDVIVANIGISESVLDTIEPNTYENSPALWIDKLPLPIAADNKYTRGHALIYGGYPMTGAARLSAIAAARSGVGLTTIAVPEIAFPIFAAALTSIMVQPLIESDAFDRLLQDKRFTAFLIGPGAGTGEDTRRLALAMLRTGKATVIDADAITAFQDNPTSLDQAIEGRCGLTPPEPMALATGYDPATGFDSATSGPIAPEASAYGSGKTIVSSGHRICVMTPHEGEFRRLFDASGDKLTRTRRASAMSGAVIILKGADTVISEPGGCSVINSNAPASLATAGSGDVLSGILLGLLAQGMEPFFAASAAVWLHGEAANRFGLGLIAEDLPNQLPTIFKELARQKSDII